MTDLLKLDRVYLQQKKKKKKAFMIWQSKGEAKGNIRKKIPLIPE